MRDAGLPAVEDDLVAGLEIWMGGCGDGAGEIDAGDHRPAPDDGRLAGQREGVLVVDGGVADPDGDVAVHQFPFAQLRPGELRTTFTPLGNPGAESLHVKPPC